MPIKKSFFICVVVGQIVLSSAIEDITEAQYASMPILFHFDDYDRCMLHSSDALYCSITFSLYPDEASNVTKFWKIIKRVNSKPSNYRHDLLRHGICVPKTCPGMGHVNNSLSLQHQLQNITDDLTQCYNLKYKYAGLKGDVIKIHCENSSPLYAVDIYDILFAIAAGFYILFVIFSSFYEGIARYKTREEYEKITGTTYGKLLSAFSIPKNFYRLVDHTPKNAYHMSLSCIQGIRFYNMVCVILTHTIMVQFATPVSNPIFTEKINAVFLNAFLTNGGYAVQTFFLISGWLLTYNIFDTFEGKTKLKLWDAIKIFLLRYIRLTPTLAVVMAFHGTWLVHISRGPFWDRIIGEEYRNCRKNWWTNLIYINNYVNKEEMCLQQTWYLATDTQLFVVFLIIIFFMKAMEKYAKLCVALVTVVGIMIPAVISYINNFDILIRQYPEPLYNYLLFVPQWHHMYSASYSNMTGYAVGVMFGYIFYKIRRRNIIISKMYVVLWWILSFGLPLSILLIAGKMYQEDYTFTRLESALYWGFGKYVFALGLGIAIFGMTQNIGCKNQYVDMRWVLGLCLWFCRWSPVQILGRLTFSAYLIHVGWIKLRMAVNRQPPYTTEILLIHSWLGDVTMAYLLATLLTLFVEMPVSALQKLFQNKNRY